MIHKKIVVIAGEDSGDLHGSHLIKAIKESNKNYKFYRLNLLNEKKLDKLIHNIKPDYIYNFAAESHVDRSILDPSPFLNSNILGTFTILDIIKNQKKSGIIFCFFYLDFIFLIE